MRKLACPSQEVSGNVTLLFLYSESYAVAVASFTGAWIETILFSNRKFGVNVASFTGAWIETRFLHQEKWSIRVASFTGAWIETPCPVTMLVDWVCRFLHGSVD